MSAPTSNQNAGQSCICDDKDLLELRRLVAAGMDQREASYLIWGDGTLPPLRSLTRAAVGRYARRHVRMALKARLPWLRLPREVA